MENMVIARFKDNETTAETDRLRQWDYGQTLRIEGLSLPDMVEVHFSIRDVGGDAERQIGTTKDGVTEVSIPDKMLENKHCKCSEYTIYAWVYLSDEVSGQTEYDIRIPVETRSRPVDFAKPNQPDFAGKVMEKLNDVEVLKADFDGLKKESDERDKQKLTRPEGAKVGQIFKVQAVNEDGTLVLEAVDMPRGDVKDVQINGTSIVGENGVAEIPNAKNGIAGLVAPYKPLGTNVQRNGILSADSMTTGEYDKASVSAFIGKGTLETSKYNIVKKALSDGKGEAWTVEEQYAARERMGIGDWELIEEITLTETANVTRTTTPDGKTYADCNFKDFLICIENSSDVGSKYAYIYRIQDDVEHTAATALNVNAGENGIVYTRLITDGISEYGYYKTSSDGYIQPSRQGACLFSGCINRIIISGCTSGTIIKIYGVRA